MYQSTKEKRAYCYLLAGQEGLTNKVTFELRAEGSEK